MGNMSEWMGSKDVSLVGEERYMWDFRYVFNDFNIVRLLTNPEEAESLEKGGRTLLVVCARNGEELKKQLVDAGYAYGENLLLADDVFDAFLSVKDLTGRSMVVWGAGVEGQKFIKAFAREIDFIVDRGTGLREFCGKKIVRPDDVDLRNHYIIVATSQFWFEIKADLEARGFHEDLDFMHHRGYFNLADAMRECVHSNPTADVACREPFDFCQINPGGYVKLCCLGMRINVGGIRWAPFQSVWRSRLARIARLSVINRTFIFCDENPCPVITTKREYGYGELFRPADYGIEAGEWPRVVNVSFDHSCNLFCAHCRERPLVATGEEKKEIEGIAERLGALMSNVEVMILAGNGEVFFSDAYTKMWENTMPGIRKSIGILTNGTLFSKHIWDKLKKNYADIGFSVSIDAATEKTYRRIRRGGDFKALQKNMGWLGNLRKNNEIRYLHMNFVVRQDNAHELKRFILWGKELGADRVRVSRVENWVYGHDAFYDHISVFNEDSSLKTEFSGVFADEIFADPIVDMINI